ncbi:MAG TPA: hypothetical protein VHW43_13990 [Puia sp.]|jgi:hypothetical protein|nr:hypothetical protein [Puia sp.]
MANRLKYYYHKLYQKLHYDTFKVLQNQARLLAEVNNRKKEVSSLEEAEFQVFSQRGEDGIIQYITSRIEIPNRIFVEFGVENYTEANTRLLLINNNWRGLVIDGDPSNIRFIKQDFIYWKYDITALHSFITRENINQLIAGYTGCRDIGLLSVDIDGNDYWVWEAIDVIQPRIVTCEYNSAFGPDRKVSVPYAPDFVRRNAHYSDLYFGASLAAFCHLAEKKGYDFIGTAGAGVNAFFVRKDLSGPFKKYGAHEDFRESANRDSRDEKGNLSFLPHAARLAVIRDLPVVDVSTGETYRIKELYPQ